MIGGRVDRRHHERVLGADPLLDRDADHLVDVALLDDEVGLPVVGAESTAVGAVLLDQREEVAQVAGDRSLAEEDPHAEAPLLQGFFEGDRLVVGADARGDVGVERGAANSGRVAVHVVGQAGRQLRQLSRVAGDDAGEVHHLSDADRAAPAQQALDVPRRERPAG